MLIISGYLNGGAWQFKQFIAANVLFGLSLFGVAHAQRISLISCLLAVIIPAGTLQSFLRGEVGLGLLLMYVALFLFLLVSAVCSVRLQKKT